MFDEVLIGIQGIFDRELKACLHTRDVDGQLTVVEVSGLSIVLIKILLGL